MVVANLWTSIENPLPSVLPKFFLQSIAFLYVKAEMKRKEEIRRLSGKNRGGNLMENCNNK